MFAIILVYLASLAMIPFMSFGANDLKDPSKWFVNDPHRNVRLHMDVSEGMISSGFADVLESMSREYKSKSFLHPETIGYYTNREMKNPCDDPFAYMCRSSANQQPFHSMREESERNSKQIINKIERTKIMTTHFYQNCYAFHTATDADQTIARIVNSRFFQSQWNLINDEFRSVSDLEMVLGRLFRDSGTKLLVSIMYPTLDSEEGHSEIPMFLQQAVPILTGDHCTESSTSVENAKEKCKSLEIRVLRTMIRTLVSHKVPYSDSLSIRNAISLESSLGEYNPKPSPLTKMTRSELDSTYSPTSVLPHQFDLKQYASSTTDYSNLYVDQSFFTRLMQLRQSTSVDTFRNYLRIGVLYSIAQNLRIGGVGAPPELLFTSHAGIQQQQQQQIITPHTLCIRLYEQLFPFQVCHYVKQEMQVNVLPIQNVFRDVKSQFIHWIRSDTSVLPRSVGGGGDSKNPLKEKLIQKIETMKLIVDHCWLFRNEKLKETIQRIETDLTRLDGHDISAGYTTNDPGAYFIENVDQIYRHPKHILLYRNHHLNRRFRDLDETFLTWNGWYYPSANAIAISNGLIYFASTKLRTDLGLQAAFVSYFIAHEVSHFIDRTVTQFEQQYATAPAVLDFTIWHQTLERIQSEYPDEGAPHDLFADWLGSQRSFDARFDHSMTTTTTAHHINQTNALHDQIDLLSSRSPAVDIDGGDSIRREKIVYFHTIMKLWCAAGKARDHPSDIVRASIVCTAGRLKQEFENLFCHVGETKS